MVSQTTFAIDDKTGHWVQHYKCNGQSYYIPEDVCDARQARSLRGCARCTLRKGGKNDPRPARRKEAEECLKKKK